MAVKVVKFGGTSMASAESINQVADIVNQDKERAYVIVSAPGKRFKEDIKVTDMLYSCFYDLEIKGECAGNFNKIRERFSRRSRGIWQNRSRGDRRWRPRESDAACFRVPGARSRHSPASPFPERRRIR